MQSALFMRAMGVGDGLQADCFDAQLAPGTHPWETPHQVFFGKSLERWAEIKTTMNWSLNLYCQS